jgi:hypothetical protein
MGKNRINNLRTITVDGNEYKWLVEDDGEDLNLKIWYNKAIFYSGNIYEDKITPAVVRDTIEEITLFTEE